MAITAAISDFFNSIYELLASVVGTFISIIQSFFSVILGFFRSILNLFTDLVSGLVDVAGGVGKFVAGMLFCLLFSTYSPSFPFFFVCNTSSRDVVLFLACLFSKYFSVHLLTN